MARDPEKVRQYSRDTRKRRIALIGPAQEARRQRNAFLRHRYGITLQQYEEMWAIQGGHCAICSSDLTQYAFAHLDHDHLTEKVRSLLCPGCNIGIGFLERDPMWIEQALAYLRQHEKKLSA